MAALIVIKNFLVNILLYNKILRKLIDIFLSYGIMHCELDIRISVIFCQVVSMSIKEEELQIRKVLLII